MRWILQILLWSAFWMLPPLLADNFPDNSHSLNRSFLLAISTAILVAINVLVLFPSFYQKKKFWLYFISGILLATIFAHVVDWIFEEMFNTAKLIRAKLQERMGPGGPGGGPGGGTFRMVQRLVPYYLVLLGSAAIEISVHAQRQAQLSIELANERLATEMKWLRWQMNPHFLFNALNNIYSLTVVKSDKAPENLMALSDMMRYMLYEGNKERVPLEKEIGYLRKYIDLQKLKDSGGMNISVELPTVGSTLTIAPQLLLPFVENAFKHSNIEDLEKGWIKVKLVQENSDIRFEVTNSIPDRPSPKDAQGGLGLANVKRLLTLTYPNQHNLIINEADQQFSVCLDLSLS